MVSSSKAAAAGDPSFHRLKRSDQEQGKDAGHANLASKLNQLKKQIQATRFALIREQVERNKKALKFHTCHLFDVAAAAEAAARAETGAPAADDMLATRIASPLCQFGGWDCVNSMGEKEIGHSQEDNMSAGTLTFYGGSQRIVVWFTKLPLVEKIPPYTTWIFLSKNQRMADDQSVVGRRQIYYDPEGNEALICSDSETEMAEPEEEKHIFSKGEDQIIWKAIQEYGLNREVLNILCQFVFATPSEIEERYEALVLKDEQQTGGAESSNKAMSEGRQPFLEKTLDAVLDSFDNLFCRRCLVFDCRLHGCSQNLIIPVEKQLYNHEHDDTRRPCSDQCYIKKRSEFQDKSKQGAFFSVSDDVEGDDEANVDPISYKNDPIIASSTSNSSTSSGADNVTLSLDILLRNLGKRKLAKQPLLDGSSTPMQPESDSGISDKKLKSSETLSGDRQLLKQPTDNLSIQISCEVAHAASEDEMREEDSKLPPGKAASGSARWQASQWSSLERDLYLKGLEMFGKNSCLIARNLLSGLKSCSEVASYMYNCDASNSKRPLFTELSLGDFEDADQEYMEQETAAKTRICRRRGRARRHKYTWKSAGHPTIRKRVGDGKNPSCRQYMPCGCQQGCSKDCPCIDNNTCCEKYCGCTKSCKNRFRGCHCAKSQCISRQCPCFAANRECDPDVCRNCWVSCGGDSVGEPPARGDGYQCANMKLLLKQQQRILLGKSDVAGWGAFIKNPVNKNEYLGEYTGELISHKEADKRGKIYDRANSSFLFDLNDQYVLDAYRKGDKLKFANHSSNPNCYAKVMLVAGDHRVGIYAKEHIGASEELFYDYRYGPDQAPAWALKPHGSKRDEATVSHARAHKVA